MPDRRGAAVLDDLPDDIVVDKILILLPPKDVGRCRVVRKSWRGATSTPEFVLEHRRRQPSLPVIDGRGRPASFVLLHDATSAGAFSQQLWPFPTHARCRKFCCAIRLHAACDGFLIVSQGARFYICNPTIRKQVLLPFRRPLHRDSIYTDNYIYGLYHHKSTGEYRVLWSRLTNLHMKEVTLYVLTVGDKESRRIRGSEATLPSIEQMYQLSYKLSWSSPVHHHGNLHWSFNRPNYITGSTGDIIVFDTEAESFRWMSRPVQQGILNRLFDMQGTLAFLCDLSPDYTALDVWVMQDYESEIWTFKYRIDVSTIEASRPLDLTSLEEKRKKKKLLDSAVRFFSEMTVLSETELLIGFNDKHVLRCNTDGKFLRMVSIRGKQYCMKLTRYHLQESIMPIPSSEKQEEDEEFPFSREFSTEHV